MDGTVGRDGGGAPGRAGRGDVPPRVLVTGGGGLLGSHLCERLVESGCRVWALEVPAATGARAAEKRAALAAARASGRLQVIDGDVRDGVLLDGLFAQAALDVVVHLAGRGDRSTCFDDPRECFEVGAAATLTLLQAMRRAHVPGLVLPGDAAAGRGAAGAEAPPSPFAVARSTAEMLARVYAYRYGIAAVVVRLPTVFGPRQSADRGVRRLAERLLRGEPLPTPPAADLPLLWVDDAVDVLRRAVAWLGADGAPPVRYRVVDLGTGPGPTLAEALRLLARELSVPASALVDGDEHRRRPYGEPGPGGEALLEPLTGERRTVLEEGIRRFADSLRPGGDG